jgi:6-phosphogluconolactonase
MKILKQLFLGSILLAMLSQIFCMSAETKFSAYIGTYTDGKSKGIYLARFDSESGKLSKPELAFETKNPSFLALHPNGRVLYAVAEVGDFQKKGMGAVRAFRIQPKSGTLTLLNELPSGGAGPCHLSVDKRGKCTLVANYGSGSFAALSVLEDGKLGIPRETVRFDGSSIDSERQKGPHAHFITFDPLNQFALGCDLGLDKVFVWKVDTQGTSKSALELKYPAPIKPGFGPRHLAFDPSGKHVYLINEMAATITVFAYDSSKPTLTELQTISTLPENYTGFKSGSEIQVHPSGKFVYGSNRGDNSIAVFSADEKSGKLTLVEHQSTQGKTPRHFAIDPTGKWLLAENQDSDNIVIFRIDQDTGKLSATGEKVEVGAPVCIQFVPESTQ